MRFCIRSGSFNSLSDSRRVTGCGRILYVLMSMLSSEHLIFHVISRSDEAPILLICTENAVTGKMSSSLNYRVCHPSRRTELLLLSQSFYRMFLEGLYRLNKVSRG